jgi:aquaporin Z
MDQELLKRCGAEAFGTAVLILVGCGAIAIGAQEGRTFVNVIGIAFAFGLSVTSMAYAVGPISGCHINPAVSVAMLCAGRMTARETIFYIIAQMVGALIGAALLVVIVKGKISGYDIAAAGLGRRLSRPVWAGSGADHRVPGDLHLRRGDPERHQSDGQS